MRRLRTIACVLGISCVVSATVQAWTPEYSIHPGITWPGARPDMRADALGRIHLVYSPTVPPATTGHIYYRHLSSTTWTAPQDLPGPDRKEPESDMCVSPDGHVYVVGIARVDNTLLTPYSVYFWEYDGTAWSGPVLVSSGQGDDGDNCGSPCISRDRNGDIHVAWSQDGMTGGEADIMYRKRQAGAWQPIQNITRNNAGTSYGSCDPDIAVDANGSIVHIVWHDDFLDDGFQVYYTKNTNLGDPAAWQSSSQWHRLSTGSYGKAPRVFLDRNDMPNVFWVDRFGGSENRQGYSRWTGSSWTAPANWETDFIQDAVFDAGNTMHAVYTHANGPTEVYYRQYQYNGATYSEMISTGPNTNKAYAATIAMDLAGNLHVVWLERKSVSGQEEVYVFYSTTAAQGPPDPVTAFAAESLDGAVNLSWTNPGSISYRGTVIRYKATVYPSSPEDGTFLCDRPAAIGSSDSFRRDGLVNGRRLYYAAFAYNADRQYSSGIHVTGMPLSVADLDRDGDVDQADFSLLQTCLSGSFVPPETPRCERMDFDGDNDVDDDDVARFLGCIAGPALSPEVNCTNQ